MFDSDLDRGEQAREEIGRDVRSAKDNMLEIREYGDWGRKGRGGGGDFSSTLGTKSQGGRGSYRSRGRVGGRRGQRSRGRGRSEGNREEHAMTSVRKSRKTMGKIYSSWREPTVRKPRRI